MFSRAILSAALLSPVLAEVTGDTFTVNCSPLTVQRSDPLVSPGEPSSHVHSVVGGTAFQRTMHGRAAVKAKHTTCDKVLDHSNYWVPQMYHNGANGEFEIVEMTGTAAYYQNRACDYEEGREYCPDFTESFARAPPAGLRMISGDPDLRTFDENDIAQRAVSHMCLGREDGVSDEETNSLPTQLCRTIRSQVTFPPCWNGRDLSSSDFKSHMAFPAKGNYNGGVCPESHPIAIMTVFYEFNFDTSVFDDRNFVFSSGDKTGYGFHGDFVNGWTDQEALNNAHKTCTGPDGVDAPECSLNQGPDGSPGHYSERKLEVAPPKENVGLSGLLRSLPGSNPPTGRMPAKRRVHGRDFS